MPHSCSLAGRACSNGNAHIQRASTCDRKNEFTYCDIELEALDTHIPVHMVNWRRIEAEFQLQWTESMQNKQKGIKHCLWVILENLPNCSTLKNRFWGSEPPKMPQRLDYQQGVLSGCPLDWSPCKLKRKINLNVFIDNKGHSEVSKISTMDSPISDGWNLMGNRHIGQCLLLLFSWIDKKQLITQAVDL